MEEKILNLTTKHCETCPLREKCIEEDCIIYQIEQVVVKK